MSRNMKQNRSPGFTLTELAIVMGVMGAIVGAIWTASGNTQDAQSSNKAVQELQDVAQGINNLMAGQKFSTSSCDSGSTFPCSVTKAMIAAQAVPSIYLNQASPTTAVDNPWNTSGFVVYALNAKNYRLSFFGTTYKGCLALLLQGTGCQANQVGCPTKVWTNNPTGGGTTGSSNLPTAIASLSANTMCSANSYPASGSTNNSVEFDYAL